MNTSIKISNQALSSLLSKIGEALGKGKDLIIHESINESTRYVYTETQGGHKEILEVEGESPIKVNQGEEEEDMFFNDMEIEMMETTKTCGETGDLVSVYYCYSNCPICDTCHKK